MFDLPLFPLNTVLFPGMPLHLHIFEDRYKRLMQFCLEKDQPFGVALIKHGSEALGPLAEPYLAGCAARIVHVEPLSEGRMNLVALGEKRFRILSLDYTLPYLLGKVDWFPLEVDNPDLVAERGQRLLPWVKAYMQILIEAGEMKLEPENLPDDPLVLAHLAAVLLQVSPAQKQALLEKVNASDLLADIYRSYRREVALLRALLPQGKGEKARRFSLN